MWTGAFRPALAGAIFVKSCDKRSGDHSAAEFNLVGWQQIGSIEGSLFEWELDWAFWENAVFSK